MNQKKALTGYSFEPNAKPEKLVILLHGYGDNAENFSSIIGDLYQEKLNVNFFVPNAPSVVPQYSFGRQWFDLYPNGINFNEGGPIEMNILKKDCQSSLELIKTYIENLHEKFDLSFEDFFVIGFSQGAMMAFEIGKFMQEKLGGVFLLSGRILPLKNQVNNLFIKTPILITHGDQDNVLEPKYFFEACKILEKQGFFYEKHLIKKEGHIISKKTIHLINNFIKKNL